MSEPVIEDKLKSVVDGKLLFISPSMLAKFDKDARFGCERAGFFEYVLGKRHPPNAKMTRGTHLALMQEIYLLSKGQKLLAGTEEQARWFKKLQPHLDKHIASGRVVGVERAVERLTIAGVRVHPNSKSDVVLSGPPEIEDLKTTGDIEKNGKTISQLRKDTQMVLYAKEFHPEAAEVKLTHSYLQVEGSLVHRPVSVHVSQTELDKTIEGTIVPLVERVKSLVGEKDVRAIDRAPQSKCFRCNHRSYCPPLKENPLMSILDKFKPKSSASAAPVSPPDQPKSEAPNNAKPVEGWTEAEKKGQVPAPKGKANSIDVDSAGNKVEYNTTRPEGLDDDEWKEMLEKRRKKAIAAAEEKIAAAKKAAEEAAKKAAEEKAKQEAPEADDADVQEAEPVKKSKGGRPPGSPNKPKQLNRVVASFGMTMNLGIDVGSVRFDASFEDYCEPEEMSEVYDALMELAKEKVHAEGNKFKEAQSNASKK